MAAITTSTYTSVIPNLGKTIMYVETPDTADSADTVDVGSMISEIDMVLGNDKETGDVITCTYSGTVITLDAAGGTTDHTYTLLVVGTRT